MTLADTLPDGLDVQALDSRCTVTGRDLFCDFGTLAGGFREDFRIPVIVGQTYLDGGDIETTEPVMTVKS